MKLFCQLWLLCLLFFPAALCASEGGSLSVFVFEDGRPLADIEVVVDGGQAYRTDDDGSLQVDLDLGRHQAEIFGKDRRGRYLGYFKKLVEIKGGKDTQVIATFGTDDDDQIKIDTPLDGRRSTMVEALGEGIVRGIVLSSETNQPIRNARIFVKGTAVEGRSGEDGRFTLGVPANIELSISVIHPEYSSLTLEKILVKKDLELTREIKLNPASVELEEFVVLAPKVQGSIASVVQEEKRSIAIANIVSADEMGKKGDSSAAGALKRVTSVTLVDGKNVYVRGLGARYSNIEMNSMPLPSPDPLKRVVPLDIFPAGAISSMKVQKSATADVPSSFGGGYIDIRTKDTFRKPFLRVSFGTKANSHTGKDVNSYAGSGTDWLGSDDGYREINSDILDNSTIEVDERVTGLTTDNFTEEELSSFTQEYVERDFEVVKKRQPLGFDLGLEGAKDVRLFDRHGLSFFGFYTYETNSTAKSEIYHNYDMEKETGQLYVAPAQSGTIDQALTEYVHNAMFNVGYNYADLFKLKYTKLYTHNADDVTMVADGVMGSNNENMTKYYLNWEERTLDVDQLSGAFDYELFGNATNCRFGFERANSRLYQPNNYHYTYRNEGEPFLDNKLSNNIANQLESNDDLLAVYLKNKFHFDLLSPEDYVDLGITASSKERKSQQYKFFLKKQGAGSIVDDQAMTGSIDDIYDNYVRPDLDYNGRSLLVNQLFKPADHYDAEVDEMNVFVNSFFKPTLKTELLIGARYVDFSQVVYQYVEDRDNPDMSRRRLITRVPEDLAINDVYPSLGVKYNLDEVNVFDLALSQTYIVPDLREFTSGEYFHPFEVATIVGNPDLVNTDIYSLDLKYGHYFSDSQSIKFGVFYKYLDNPIEDVMMPSSSLPVHSFDNADQATIYGLEIDGRKDFSFIMGELKNYYLAGNFSLIKSEVSLTSEQESTYSTNARELQGLSPMVINLTLGYDRRDRSITLSYNKMEKRIRKVGMIDDGDSYPDHYEDPAAILDFVWIEKFRHGLSLKIKIGNIQQDETVWTQGGRVTKSYAEPLTFSLGLSYAVGL